MRIKHDFSICIYNWTEQNLCGNKRGAKYLPCLAMPTYIASCHVLLMIALAMMPHYVIEPIAAHKPGMAFCLLGATH